MSKKTRAGVTRENFLKMRGGKLISVEAYVLAFIVFLVLTMVKDVSPIISLIIAAIVGFVFPILVGTFKSLAWPAAIIFSFAWASLAFVFAGAIAKDSVIIGLLVGVVFFVISFLAHKNYSGLSFQKVSRNIRKQQVMTIDEPIFEKVSFCPKCGRRIKAADGKCDFCDSITS